MPVHLTVAPESRAVDVDTVIKAFLVASYVIVGATCTNTQLFGRGLEGGRSLSYGCRLGS